MRPIDWDGKVVLAPPVPAATELVEALRAVVKADDVDQVRNSWVSRGALDDAIRAARGLLRRVDGQ